MTSKNVRRLASLEERLGLQDIRRTDAWKRQEARMQIAGYNLMKGLGLETWDVSAAQAVLKNDSPKLQAEDDLTCPKALLLERYQGPSVNAFLNTLPAAEKAAWTEEWVRSGTDSFVLWAAPIIATVRMAQRGEAPLNSFSRSMIPAPTLERLENDIKRGRFEKPDEPKCATEIAFARLALQSKKIGRSTRTAKNAS